MLFVVGECGLEQDQVAAHGSDAIAAEVHTITHGPDGIRVGLHLQFVLNLVQAGASRPVAVMASVAPPIHITALETSNDSATDTDAALDDAVFQHGYES